MEPEEKKHNVNRKEKGVNEKTQQNSHKWEQHDKEEKEDASVSGQ